MTARAPKPGEEVPTYDTKKNPNDQPALVGDIHVAFVPTVRLRWVKRRGVFVLQQAWERAITRATLGLKAKPGTPAVAQVWIDVPQGEE